MRRAILLVAVLAAHAAPIHQKKPPNLVAKVEPKWGDLNSNYLVESTVVEMQVDHTGKPYAVRSMSGLPDPVVQALEQWRFTPFKKDRKQPTLPVEIRIPIRRKLTPDLELSQRPRWTAPNELQSAVALAIKLDPPKVAELLAHLPASEAPDYPRTALLFYYPYQKGPVTPDDRNSRRDLLLYLIHTFPQDPILFSNFAAVNAAGEPWADAEGIPLLKKAWLAALKDYPNDIAVSVGAANFLQTVDPVSALRIISEKTGWDIKSNYLGQLYATAGLGVDAISPKTGQAIGVVSRQLSETGLAASFRRAILESRDLVLVLSAVVTTSDIARQLDRHHIQLDGYQEFCDSLMKHTRQLNPQTSLNCGLSAPAKDPADYTHWIAPTIAASHLIGGSSLIYTKHVKQFESEALSLQAVIDPTGQVRDLQLLRGPLSLYQLACMNVSQRRYRPFVVKKDPATVSTQIIVRFAQPQIHWDPGIWDLEP